MRDFLKHWDANSCDQPQFSVDYNLLEGITSTRTYIKDNCLVLEAANELS